MTHDYTRKGGVVHSEILLPEHAPEVFRDRSALWNSVEQIEKHRRAQLTREIEIALPNELSRTEQIRLVRDYCQRTFVAAGMCVDFSIHDPEKQQKNAHAHILLTMRPLNLDGSWGDKQKKEYILDTNGEKIYDPKKRQYKCNTISTINWNDQSKAEEWRQAWANIVNSVLEQQNTAERIDHRSYKRQGIDKIPTIHMGVAATQMERRGIFTEKGEINRMIRQDNRIIRELKGKIHQLSNWLKNNKEEFSPLIEKLLAAKTDQNSIAKTIDFLQSKKIYDWDGLENYFKDLFRQLHAITSDIKQSEKRLNKLWELLDAAVVYRETSSIYRQYDQQGDPKKRQQFYDTHTAEIIDYRAAKQKLDALLPDNKLHIKEWQQEYNRLVSKRSSDYAELRLLREHIKEVEKIRKQVYIYQRSQEQQRKRELER